MLANRIIPSLLLKNKRLVKGERFGQWRDAGNPPTTARAYNAQRADELILLDIDASVQNRGPDLEAIYAVAAECQMPLTVGGGINSVELALDCIHGGADKIFVNTASLDNPNLIDQLAHVLGSQAIVLGVDVLVQEETAAIYDHRTGQQHPFDDWIGWIKEMVERGAGELRLMAVDREGTRLGLRYNLWRQISSIMNIPVILEGGAGTLEHLNDAMAAGVNSIALGTMLVFSDNNIIQIKRHLKNAGHNIRV